MEMRNKTNAYLLCRLLFLCVFSVTSTTFLKDGYGEEYSKPASPDLSSYAIYSNYDFNNTEDVVNLGTQPFFSPTSFVTEAMKRGTTLHNALSGSGIEVRFFPFMKGKT